MVCGSSRREQRAKGVWIVPFMGATPILASSASNSPRLMVPLLSVSNWSNISCKKERQTNE